MSGSKFYVSRFWCLLTLLLLLMPACRDDEQDGASRGDREVIFDVSLQGVQPVRGALPAYDDRPVVTDQGDTCYLGVSVSTEWPVAEPATRASLSSTADLQTSSTGFGLYQYDGSTQKLDNVQYKYVDALWSPQFGDGAVWPGSGTTTFYAYAPYVSSNTWTDNSKLSFTVHASNSAQTDLLVAQSTYANVSSGRVALNFTHALTTVRFVANNNINLTIKSIAFTGVANSGKYDFRTSAWTDVSGSESISIAFDSPYRDVTGSASLPELTHTTNTAPHDEYFLMMPQTFSSSSAKIVITKSDDTTIEFSLNGTAAWEPGTVVTYELKKNSISYTFELSTSELSKTCQGGAASFGVTSIKSDDGVESYPEFTVEYEQSAGSWTTTLPSWISYTPTMTSSASPASQSMSLSGQTETISSTTSVDALNNMLTHATALGSSSNPYDLSLVNVATGAVASSYTGRSTANCYVVQAPGWYKIPMVYGNAIKNGSTYINGGTYLVNHAGTRISHAWLSEHSVSVTSAQLLWQDAPSLISNISVTSYTEGSNSRTFIKFYVDSSTITQGNALIAAKTSDGKIAWSWHIWVTPLDMTHPVNYGSGSMNDFHLGWVWSQGNDLACMSFAPRQAVLRFTQAGSNYTKQLTVTQSGKMVRVGSATHTTAQDGFCPTYQWGRKDPFWARYQGVQPNTFTDYRYNASASNQRIQVTITGNGSGVNQRRSVYDGSGTAITWATPSHAIAKRLMEKGVLDPLKTYTFFDAAYLSHDSYVFSDYAALWGDYSKTVYDPSPVGFRVPSLSNLSSLHAKFTTTYWQPGGWEANDETDYLLSFPFAITSNGLTSSPVHAIFTSSFTDNQSYLGGMLWLADENAHSPIQPANAYGLSVYQFLSQSSTSYPPTYTKNGYGNAVRGIGSDSYTYPVRCIVE